MAATSSDLPLFYDFYEPGDVSACAGIYATESTCPVPSGASGTWTLQVASANGNAGSFHLSIQRLDRGVGCKKLGFGALATGKLKEPASSACFTLTASSGDYLYARSVGTSGTIGELSGTLATPTGNVVCTSTGPVECALPNGTLTLLLYSPSEITTGSFRIYAQQMTAPRHCKTLAVGGGARSGSVTKPGGVACFTFAGIFPDSVTATITGLTGTISPEIVCFGPTGAPAIDPVRGDSALCPVTSTGQYTTLVFDSTGPGTGSFSMALT
jgi:hypothetical protein